MGHLPDRVEGEKLHQLAMFTAWCLSGETEITEEFCQNKPCSTSNIRRWARIFHWKERKAAWLDSLVYEHLSGE